MGTPAGLPLGEEAQPANALRILRTIPILCPADSGETHHAFAVAIEHRGPVHSRLGPSAAEVVNAFKHFTLAQSFFGSMALNPGSFIFIRSNPLTERF